MFSLLNSNFDVSQISAQKKAYFDITYQILFEITSMLKKNSFQLWDNSKQIMSK